MHNGAQQHYYYKLLKVSTHNHFTQNAMFWMFQNIVWSDFIYKAPYNLSEALLIYLICLHPKLSWPFVKQNTPLTEEERDLTKTDSEQMKAWGFFSFYIDRLAYQRQGAIHRELQKRFRIWKALLNIIKWLLCWRSCTLLPRNKQHQIISLPEGSVWKELSKAVWFLTGGRFGVDCRMK